LSPKCMKSLLSQEKAEEINLVVGFQM
jgi:hypothetical protein